MSKKDYYEILGVSKDASEDEIRRAYKKLAIKWHPDKHQNDKREAEEKFKEISEAYSVLSDPKKKNEYDNGGVSFEGFGDFDDFDPFAMFESFFGSRHGKHGGFGNFGFGFDDDDDFFGGGFGKILEWEKVSEDLKWDLMMMTSEWEVISEVDLVKVLKRLLKS